MGLEAVQYKLAMHLIGTHCNAGAITGSFDDLADDHQHEHFGPGGLRNHSYTDYSFDERKVEQVLEEIERDERPIRVYHTEPERGCPDGGQCGHFCQPGYCYRVRCCSPFTNHYPDEPDGHWPVEIEAAELAGLLGSSHGPH